MTRDPFAKVTAGDVIDRIAPQLWNGMIDAALDVQRRQKTVGGNAGGTFRRPGEVLVKNVSGDDQERFAILQPAGPVFDPATDDGLEEFQNHPCLNANLPNDDQFSRFLILQEPIPRDEFGFAMLFGITAVKIDVQTSSDQFADAIPDDPTKLKSRPYGGARILTPYAGSGSQWHYVALQPGPVTTFAVNITERSSQFYSWAQVAGAATGTLNAAGPPNVLIGSQVNLTPTSSGQFSFEYQPGGALAKAGSGGVPARASVPGSATVSILNPLLNVIDTVTAFNWSTVAVASNAFLMLKYFGNAWWVDWEQC